MRSLLITLFVSALSQAGGNWPTFAEALRDHRVPVPAGVNASGRITSFSVFDDERWFALAYYDVVPDGRLHDLHVCLFDRRQQSWRWATHGEIGSILSIHRSGRLFYVEGHASPSATPLLVLDERLLVKKELDGWPKLFLRDGRLIFNRSMRHFAPTHAEVLAVYEPSANREASIFPAGADNDRGAERVPGSDLWLDRTIGEVKADAAARTLEFDVTTQPRRIESDNQGHPAGPERKLHVTCDTSKPLPACTPARD